MISLRTQKDMDTFRQYLEGKFAVFKDQLKKAHVTFDPINPIEPAFINEFLQIINTHAHEIRHLEIHGLKQSSIDTNQLLSIFTQPKANNLRTIVLDYSVKEKSTIQAESLINVIKNQPQLNYLSLSINDGDLKDDSLIIDQVLNSQITALKILHNIQIDEKAFKQFKLKYFSSLFNRYGMIQFQYMANQQNRFEFAINQLYFAQIITFQRHISQFLSNNPQELLFDLYENRASQQNNNLASKMQGPVIKEEPQKTNILI